MYGDFIESVNGGTSSFTLIIGIMFITTSIGALFTNSVAKISSMRTTALLGGIFYFVGSFASIFVTSVDHLIITSGILPGKWKTL